MPGHAVPPLQPLIDKDVVEVFDGDVPLDERLRDFFAHPDEAIDRARTSSRGLPRVIQLRGRSTGRGIRDRATPATIHRR